nr:unnamed protein product [Callosobruchus analis]
MQQQQLAAQLSHGGHHGGGGGSGRPPPGLSPTPSDSDSDISLGAHSPPGGAGCPPSPPPSFAHFRFGAHSPGPMPAQFRFAAGGGTVGSGGQLLSPPGFRHTSPTSKDSESPSAINLRLTSDSPIDVDSSTEKGSPVRVDSPPPPPPMNLRIADGLRMDGGTKIETPLPLRIGHHMTAPLRIQVSSANRLMSPHTNIPVGHGGIVRIAPPSPTSNPPPLHRPFSPPRLT